MTGTGSPGFVRYAESLTRLVALQAELDQEFAMRRCAFRASLIDISDENQQDNLAPVFAYHRHRMVHG